MGQLWSTFDDMARWARFVLGDTGEVLHPDTVAEMRVPGSVDDGLEWRAGYGLGLQLLRVPHKINMQRTYIRGDGLEVVDNVAEVSSEDDLGNFVHEFIFFMIQNGLELRIRAQADIWPAPESKIRHEP